MKTFNPNLPKSVSHVNIQARIIQFSVFVFVLALLFLFILTYNNSEQRLINSFKNSFSQRALSLDNSLNDVVQHIYRMKTIAEDHLTQDIDNILLNTLTSGFDKNAIFNKKKNYLMLKDRALLGNQINYGTLAIISSIKNNYQPLQRLIFMSLGLMRVQKTFQKNNNNIVLSFFTHKKNNLIEVYPKIDFDKLLKEYKDLFQFLDKTNKIQDGLDSPEKNPAGTHFWLNPYLDPAGNGMMVSCAIPVYDEKEHIGIIGSDIILNFLDKYTRHFNLLPGKMILVSETNQIISASELKYKKKSQIIYLKDYTPLKKGNSADIIYKEKLRNVPWTLLYIIKKQTLRSIVINELKFIFIILFIFIIIVITGYFYINKHFIKPGIKAEKDLKLLNQELDNKVIKRTRELKEREEQLSHSRKMDAIGQLAGGVAHDFNNMLGGIMSAAQLLKLPKRNLDEKGIKYVDMIQEAAKRAADLTSKLLAFGRKGKITSTPIDIHKVIDNTISLFKRTFDKKIKISINQNAKNHIIIGDDSALQNAFLNIGINASHAMPDGGELQIKSRNIELDKIYCDTSPFNINTGEYIEIEIRDTGNGIPQKNLKMIFEPFFTTKEKGKGTGLGLAAAYGTIQDHHGAINVYSEINIGTAFYIFLPCSGSIVQTKSIMKKNQTGSGLILLVDDEKLIRITGQHILEDMGYDVILAENGRQAVEIFRKDHDKIDLIILDMIMPEMNGRDAFFEMKKTDKNCKVIISSGFTKNESLDELRKHGLSGFMQKPFSSFELSQLLADVLKP